MRSLLVWWVVITVLFVVSYLAVMSDWVWLHEQAHVEANKHYGIPSSVTMTFTPGLSGISWTGQTKNSTPGDLTPASWDRLNDLHVLNEIYGYNVAVLIKAGFVLTYLLTISIGGLLLIFGEKQVVV